MSNALISGAGQLQLLGLAALVVMVIILGMRIMGQGPKGFASLLTEVLGLLAAVFLVMRPNDALAMLSHMVGGVQTPTMPS